jgi:hypothetical protein
MGMFDDLFEVAVSVALIPVAVVEDVINAAEGRPTINTLKLPLNAVKKTADAGMDLLNGDL